VLLPFGFALLLLCASPNYRAQPNPRAEPLSGDFLQEWVGGWIVLQGDRDRLYEPDYAKELEHTPELVGFQWNRNRYLPMVYPPFYYLLVSSFSLLPMSLAMVVWTMLMAACLSATIFLLQRFSPGNSKILRWGVPLALLFVPLIESLSSGQKSTLLLLLFTATYLLLKHQRPFWAGVVFGLIAFKPQLVLVLCLVMLFKRQWSFVAGAILTGALLACLSLLVGIDVCWQYVELCMGMTNYVHTGGYDLHKSHCWWGACQLLLSGAPDGVVKLCAFAGSLLTLGLLARLLRGSIEPNQPKFELQFSGIILATLLLSPHLFTYDLTLLLLPFLLIAKTSHHSTAILRKQRPFLLTMGMLLFVMGGLFAPIADSSSVQWSVLLMVALLGSLSQAAAQSFSIRSKPLWNAAPPSSLQYE